MRAFPVLPVKFGTVLPDETWVRRLLAQGEALFRTTLEKFAGLVQMEVVVPCPGGSTPIPKGWNVGWPNWS